MATDNVDDKFRLMFAPDHWTALGKLKAFLGPPFRDSRELQNALQASVDRARRFETLAALANRLQPSLLEDLEELERTGFTPAQRSSEFAALIEVLLCELYAVLDALRYTLYWAYPTVRGVQKKSTSKLFSRASEGQYGEDFPKEIVVMLKTAYNDWFLELRRFRTELTHGGTGSCHIDKDSHRVKYIHSGLGSTHRALVIDDVVGKVNELTGKVFVLMRGVGDYMYRQLRGEEKIQFCGIYKGRMYTRRVAPSPDLTWQSGICDAKRWFEEKPEFHCPLANRCEAYARAAKA